MILGVLMFAGVWILCELLRPRPPRESAPRDRREVAPFRTLEDRCRDI